MAKTSTFVKPHMPRFFVLFCAIFFAVPAYSIDQSPQTFTLDGQLFQAGSTNPLVQSNIKITVQILNQSKDCILYSEAQTVDTTLTNGFFNIQVGSTAGDSKRVSGVDAGRTMEEVFQNSTVVQGKEVANTANTCNAAASAALLSGTSRYFRIVVTPNGGTDDVLSPDMMMDAVPTAIVAQSVQGLQKSNIIQTNAAKNVTQTDVENWFNGSEWAAILGGTYLGPLGALIPTGTADATTYLRGDGQWVSVVGGVSSVAGKTGAVTLVAADITDFQTAADARITAVVGSWKGAANGIASLDAGGKVPVSQIPTLGYLTSVGVTAPSFMTVANSPLTADGTIGLSMNNQLENMVLAGAASGGGSTVPAFRLLKSSDIKNAAGTGNYVNQTGSCSSGQALGHNSVTDSLECQNVLVDLTSTNVSGTLPISKGGTGVTTVPTNGQVLVGNGTGYVAAGITGTSNQVTVTNGSGSITLSTPQDIHTAATPQFAGMGIGAAKSNASAVLELTSTTQGLLIPRMTTGERTAIATPAIGLQVYDTVANKLYYYDGAWQPVGATGSGLDTLNGLTAATQTFAIGTTGTAPAFNSATSTHTLNIPSASGAGVTAGTISKTEYDTFDAKLGTSSTFSGDVSGTSSTMSVDKIKGKTVSAATATGQMMIYDGTNWVNNVMSGDATMPSTGVLTIGTGAVTSGKIADLTIVDGDISASAAIARSKLASGTANHVIINDGSGVLSSEAQLSIARGGTGISTVPTNGQILIGNGTGYVAAGITGTSNQVTVTNGSGSITLSTPQDIHTAATPQFAGMGIGAANSTASAIVEMSSTSKGLLIPRMTNAQMVAIATPATGLQVYDTTNNKLNYYNGSAWAELGVAGTGISTLGGLSATSQTFAIGTTGTAPAFNSATSTHTLNIPSASGAGVTAGTISKTEYDTFDAKLGTSSTFSGDVSGTSSTMSVDKIKGKTVTAATATGQMMIYDGTNWVNNVMSGDATMPSTGVLTIGTGAVTSGKIADLTIVDGDISASAAIAKSKIASGSNYSIIVNNGSGALAELNGATAGTIVQYGVTGPVYSTATYPSSTTANQLLYSSANNVVGGLATANSSVLTTDGSGVPTWASVIPVVNGGTGQSTYTDGQLLIGNSTGNTLTKASLTGTSNQVTVTNGSGSITLSTPQDIHTAATPQFAGMGIGAANSTTSAIVEMSSTSKGLLIPRMTNAQMVAIAAPATGLQVYDTTNNKLNYYNGAAWAELGVAGTGISTLGGLSATAQSFAVGTSGTAPAFNSATSTHTLNIPMASTAAVTAGLISKTDYDTFSAKLGTSSTFSGDVSGTSSTMSVDKIKGKTVTAATATDQMMLYDGTNWVNNVMSGDATMASTGVVTISGLARSKLASGTANHVIINDGTGVLSSEAQLSVTRGGTGQSTYTDGQLLIGNSTGNTLTKASLTGTSNQVTVTNGSGSITLSTPQDIHTAATPQFAGMGIGAANSTTSAIVEMSSTSKGLLIPRMTNAQMVAIATPATGLQVYDTTNNKLNYYNGSAWAELGVAGSGISTLGGLSATAQSFAVGASGTAPAFNSATSTHTLNIPMASTAAVTAGLISKTDYDTFNNKLSAVAGSTLNSAQFWVGNGSNQAAAVTMSGDATLSNAGALTISSLARSKIATGSNYSIVVNNGSGALAELNGATAGTIVQYGVTGPVYSTATYPSSTTVNQLLYSSANNVVGGLTTANNSVLTTDGSGVPTWASVIPVVNGGTGQSTYTDGQLLIGNSTGNTLTKASLTGTSNQVTVTNGSGSITLSTPQDIHTAATPQFAGMGIGAANSTASAIVEMSSTSKGLLIPRMTNAQMVAIATPATGLQVYDTTNNKLNYYNGSGWSELGVAGSGISTLGGLSATSQTFAIGTTGTAPAFSSATSTHTLNIPMAATATVTAGLISKTEYDTFNNKLGTSLNSAQIFVGNGSNVATGVSMSGDATISNTGALTITGLARSKLASGTANHVIINDGSGVLSSEAQLAISRGGTGVSTVPTNGQLLIGNGTGYTAAALTGTTDQVTVTNGAGTITLSTPQNINTTSSPQFAGLGIGAANSTASAILEMSSTSKGLLIPRMTNAQMVAIATPATGLQVYDTTNNKLNYYNGSGWSELGVAGTGISTLGGLSATAQTFAIGTTGTAPAFSSATSTHTLNIPSASGAGVTAGTISKTEYDTFDAKLGTATTFVGDVGGTYATTSVDKIKGKTVSPVAYATGQVLRYDGTNWVNAALSVSDFSGTVGIGSGGTGAITKTLGFNALSPITTKGDLITSDGTNNVRMPAGTNGYALIADSAETNGLKYGNPVASDISSMVSTGIVQRTAANTYSTVTVGAPLSYSSGTISTDPNYISISPTLKNAYVGDRLGTYPTRTIMDEFADLLYGVNTTAPNGYLSVYMGHLAGANSGTGPIVSNVANVGIGAGALEGISSGMVNVALGLGAAEKTADGSSNVAIGTLALNNSVSTSYNIAIGDSALRYITTGTDMVALGRNSAEGTSGNRNIAIGFQAFQGKELGDDNTVIGANAYVWGDGDTTDQSFSTSLNTIVGANAIATTLKTDYSTVIGADTTMDANLEKVTLLGYGAAGTVSNTMILGGTGANAVSVGIGTSAPGYTLHVVGDAGKTVGGTSWTSISDRRLKDVQGDYEYGLSEILKLHTVRFTYKNDNKLGLTSKNPQTGFIAQEVQKVIPDAVRTRADGYLELNVDPIHWATVNAVQELHGMCKGTDAQVQQQARSIASIETENKAMKSKIVEQDRKIQSLEERLQRLESLLNK